MPAIRFRNPELQAQLIAGLQAGGLAGLIQSDGFVVCDDEQWPAVSSIAHRIRDRCFKWYFRWYDSREEEVEFLAHLESNGLRFEVEDHKDRVVFLLPKEDEAKHASGASAPAVESCSFCGKKWTEVQQLVTSASAAICGECITSLYEDLSTSKDRES